jgi:valyl-tRNA synthetase
MNRGTISSRLLLIRARSSHVLLKRQPAILPQFSKRCLSLKPKPHKEFAPSYNAKTVEEGWYEWWNAQGLFKASSADYMALPPPKKPFTMITPPPNVTGSLHIGHALTFSVQDAIVRWKRMNGYDVQWIPGTDHAGIGTQSVVEKMLMKERGLTRHDLGREAFVKEIWKWKEKYGNRILHQMRRMGASLDWDKEFFTMDEPRYEAVQNAFMRLHKDGLIYRDTRLVNWCCALETVISDIEVDYKDVNGRTLISLPGRQKP